MPLRLVVVLLGSMAMPLSVMAEVYRWTDENGRVHFSDQARAPVAAKAVEIDTNKMNITSELSTPEQLQRLAEEKDEARQKQLEELKAKQKNAPSKQDWCDWARRYLRSITRSVVFVDENDKPVKVSERERQSRAEKLTKDIKSRCS